MAGGHVRWASYSRELFGSSVLSDSISRYTSRRNASLRPHKSHLRMFTVAPNWKQPKSPFVGKWVNKLVYSYN